jgi:hypothetical protein
MKIEKKLDSLVRRSAEKVGCIVRKDRSRIDDFEHQGGYMLLDASTKGILAGSHYELTPQCVLEICSEGK